MGFLYITPKGVPWRKHSYSAGLDFDRSPLLYKLRRIDGWKVKDDKASLKFGRALEESVQHFHDNNATGGLEAFIRKWTVHKDDKELKFTKTEKDWDNLNRNGQDMMKLYAIRQPSLPIPIGGQSVFQREYAKEVYPDDPNYGDIFDAGKLDVVCYVDPHHPMLAKLDWKPEYGALRPLIVDIKTGAKDFHDTKGICRFDLQLRRYSWLSDIRDVSFLWFKKSGYSFNKGVSVTLLEDAGTFKAGDEAVVAMETDNGIFIVLNDYFITEMDKAQGRKENGNLDTTKAAQARKTAWLEQNAVLVPESVLTRCRIQFNSAFITFEEAAVAGRVAGRQIQGIVNCWKSNTWDNLFQVRYPHDDTNDPYFRAFVLNDENFRKLNFEKSDQMDDLFTDEISEEE